ERENDRGIEAVGPPARGTPVALSRPRTKKADLTGRKQALEEGTDTCEILERERWLALPHGRPSPKSPLADGKGMIFVDFRRLVRSALLSSCLLAFIAVGPALADSTFSDSTGTSVTLLSDGTISFTCKGSPQLGAGRESY